MTLYAGIKTSDSSNFSFGLCSSPRVSESLQIAHSLDDFRYGPTPKFELGRTLSDSAQFDFRADVVFGGTPRVFEGRDSSAN